MERIPRHRTARRSRCASTAAHALVLGVAIVLAAPPPGALSAQTIDGVLLERGTDRPIDLGLITLLTTEGDSVASVLTDPMGRFRVVAGGSGDYLLAASALGYQTTIASSVFTLDAGGGLSLQFRIPSMAIEIAGLTVEASSSLIREPNLVQNGFVDRAQAGFGRFITPHDIEASHSLTTSDLLSRTGRITTRPTPFGDRILMLGQVGYCSPVVFLDGVRIAMSDMSIDNLVPVHILEAAEVYRTASEAPVRYGGGMGGCGVVVLWTRTR